MKLGILGLLVVWLHSAAFAADLPVRFFNSADKTKPLVFYISGDGGWNNFSTSLVQSLNQQGFPVVGLDAKAYFWDRKTPDQTAQDVATLLQQYSAQWEKNGVVFIGYSFGADVMPFVQSRLPKPILQSLKTTLLLSPSERTDFEVHLLDAFTSSSHALPVMPEINQLTKPVTLFFGSDEKTDYAKAITSKTVHVITLDGGHHYNNDGATLAKQLINAVERSK